MATTAGSRGVMSPSAGREHREGPGSHSDDL